MSTLTLFLKMLYVVLVVNVITAGLAFGLLFTITAAVDSPSNVAGPALLAPSVWCSYMVRRIIIEALAKREQE